MRPALLALLCLVFVASGAAAASVCNPFKAASLNKQDEFVWYDLVKAGKLLSPGRPPAGRRDRRPATARPQGAATAAAPQRRAPTAPHHTTPLPPHARPCWVQRRS
jgi:hypothetical protein